ncbi:hypothetical protein F5J12DRAFT_714139 [Pisolithus orientalis]|uniref:uncharacterized protein n=1 Tax=Pisolithus orientalis TaxID=936130 RepID=UPI00222506CB|nr:uncharacterized protein F5J12DRAFT_714139 [Pisolithus orientalis]KAI6030602.1 hypothetical protein F5J12DRAFT_714139 [Pisolithus orientalis]
MSIIWRAALILVQAVFNQAACTPPNKTEEKFRYHTQEPLLLRIAPVIFKLHTVGLWWIAVLEGVAAINRVIGTSLSPSLSAYLDAALLSPSRSQKLLTPIFVTGIFLSVIGSCIRVRCFQELGQFFTFDLTIHPDHKLITSGPYSYVRHPAYTGSLLLLIGVTFSHLTAGSLVVEYLFGSDGAVLVWAIWWIWTIAVAQSRVVAEDQELQKRVGSEWDVYAAKVKYRLIPGVL